MGKSFGPPKPYSTQCRENRLIRSRYGRSMTVVPGSIAGKFGVVSPISPSCSLRLQRCRCDRTPPRGTGCCTTGSEAYGFQGSLPSILLDEPFLPDDEA